MSDTATFLAQAVPWPTAATPGWVNIHSPYLRPGTAKPIMPGHAFTDVNLAVRNAAWKASKSNDVYVCMSLQRDARPAKAGKRNRGAMRHADAAVLLKSLWLDVDLKDGFTDDVDLLHQFGVFRRAVGLPVPSFVVSTGGGYHFHWVLDEPVTLGIWQVRADALRNACQQHNFKADHKCTVDAARLMRVPGTFNHKTVPAKPVVLFHMEALVTLQDLDVLLTYRSTTSYGPRVSPAPVSGKWSLPPGSKPAAAFAGQSYGPTLNSGIEHDAPPMDVVADACPWFKDALATGGAKHREPEWFEALKVSYHTKEGQETAHEVSGGHAGYTVPSTDEKYETAAESAERYGWPQCQTIKDAGSTWCAGCEHLPKGKSPLNFTLPGPQGSPSSAGGGAGAGAPPPGSSPPPPSGASGPPPPVFMPTGYRYCADGFIEHLIKEKDQERWVRMYPGRVDTFARQQVNREIGFGKELLHFQYESDSGYRPVQITFKEAQDGRAFKSVLNAQGMMFKDNEAQHMGRFMAAFVQQLRDARHLSIECEPYGWAMKGGIEDAFTFDNMRFNCTGHRKVVPPDVNLGNKYKATGDLALWKEACKLITDQKRPALDAIVACGLAAPLVQMTGHNGFVVSAYSTATGVQKTAAMRVGHAMWGDPDAMAGLDDTNNYLNTRLAVLRHLPLYVDELKFEGDMRKAEVLVLGITQGKSKGRLTRDSQTMETTTFSTMMVTASNASLVQHISESVKTTTAGMARIFEFGVAPHHDVGRVDMHVAQALIGNLRSNYGTAGRIYAEFLGQNVDRVRKDVRAMCATINDIKQAGSDERFWVAAVAVLIVGAQYGNELELTNIDVNALSRFLLDQFDKQRGDSAASPSNVGTAVSVDYYVTGFINSHTPQTLKTDTVATGAGGVATKVITMNDINSIAGLSRGISIHAVKAPALVRFSKTDFTRWLARDQKVSPHEIIKSIKAMPGVTEHKASLGRGTQYKKAPEWVLEFDVNVMPNLDLF